jgi:tetratricopeptide (TPR) repeat protein
MKSVLAPADLRQALAQTQQALTAAQAASDRAGYLSALEQQAQLQLAIGDAKAAAPSYSLLLKVARGAPGSAPDARRAAEALVGLAQCEMQRGDLNAAAASLKQALDLIGERNQPGLLARLLACQGRLLMEQGQLTRAAEILLHAMSAARQSRNASAAAQTLLAQAWLTLESTSHEAARGLAGQALQAAQAAADPAAQVESLCALAAIALKEDDPAQSKQLAAQALQLARQTGCRRGEALALSGLAEALLEEAARASTLTETRQVLARAAPLLEEAHALAGQLEYRAAGERALRLLGHLGQLQDQTADTARPAPSPPYAEPFSPGSPADERPAVPFAPPPPEERILKDTDRLPSETEFLEGLVAQGLERFYAGQASEALNLYAQALGGYRKAAMDMPAQADILFLMGDAHRQVNALEQAAQCYQQSIEFARKSEYAYGEAASLGGLAAVYAAQSAAADEAQARLAMGAQALETLNQAIQRSRQAEDPALAGRLWSDMAAVQTSQGRYIQALHSLQSALAEFRATDDPMLVRAALLELGEGYARMEEFSAAADTFEEAINIEQPPHTDDEYAQALMGFALACDALAPGDIDQAIDTLAEAMQNARRGADPNLEVRTLSNLGWLLSKRCKQKNTTDDLAHSADLSRKAMEIAATNGTAEMIGLAAYNWGRACLNLGLAEEALEYLPAALETYVQAGLRLEQAKAHIALGELDYAAGQHPAALAHFEEAVRIYQECDCHRLEIYPSILCGEASLALGDHPRARQRLEKATRQAREFKLAEMEGRAWLCLGRLCLAENQPAQQALQNALAALQTASSPLAETAQALLAEAEQKGSRKKGGGLFRKK